MNHWAQQCRSSGRRNSSTGGSPSLGRPQNRQRQFSSKQPSKGRGHGGGGGKQRSTPNKKPGQDCGRGGSKPFKMNALTVTGLSGPQHPPKVGGLGGNETKEIVSMKAGLLRPAHPPKVSGEPIINTFTCDALTSNGNDTAYDSYIAETLYSLKSAIKPKKQTRFAGDPVSSVKTIPARRTRSHPPKWTIKAGDPDLLIPIELSQARAESDLNQDLGGDLSVVSPSEI